MWLGSGHVTLPVCVYCSHNDEPFNDDPGKQSKLVGLRAGGSSPSLSLALTLTCEVSIKAKTFRVSRMLRRCTEKLAGGPFSFSALSPHLCSTCRGLLLKSAALLWGAKTSRYHHRHDISKVFCQHSTHWYPWAVYDVKLYLKIRAKGPLRRRIWKVTEVTIKALIKGISRHFEEVRHGNLINSFTFSNEFLPSHMLCFTAVICAVIVH